MFLALAAFSTDGLGDTTGSSVTVTSNGTASGEAGTLPWALNNVASGGTVGFDLASGSSTISFGSTTLSTPSSTSFVNNNAGTATVDLGGGSLLTSGTFNWGSGLTLTSSGTNSVSLVASTTSLSAGSIGGNLSATSGGSVSGIYSAGSLTINSISGGNISAASSDSPAYGICSNGNMAIGDVSGSIRAVTTNGTASLVPAAGIGTLGENSTLSIGTISQDGNVSVNAQFGGILRDVSGVHSPGDVTIGVIAGTISGSVDAGYVYGVSSSFGAISIHEISKTGSIRASTDGVGRPVGIGNDFWPSRPNIRIDNLEGSVDANGRDAVAIAGNAVTITNLSGSVSAEDNASDRPGNAVAIGSLSGLTIGTISGSVCATAEHGGAIAILPTNGGLNGGNANTAALITGTVSATGRSATAICSAPGTGQNIKVADGALVSAIATDPNARAYAIYTWGGDSSKVELVAGCHILGDIRLGGSADLLVLSGSSGSTTCNGNISGAETVNVTGGNWNIDGGLDGVTALNVTGGQLRVASGTISSDVIVASGGSVSFNAVTTGTATVQTAGLLGGTGTVASLTNNGILAPGNSIGTFNVIGDFTNANDATLTVQVNDAGEADKISVSGTAKLNGGTVNVLAEEGAYKSGTTYTILTASSVSGAFSGITDDLAFLDALLIYDNHFVCVILHDNDADYDTVARTYNQHGVARYLDRQASGATGDFSTVLNNINALSASGARSAYDAMGGEIFGSLSTIGIEEHERFLHTISQRLQSQSMIQGFDDATAGDRRDGNVSYVSRDLSSTSGWTTWTQGYGVGAAIATNGNASGLGYSTGGVAVGMERQVSDQVKMGVAGGYASSYAALDSRRDTASIDGGSVALYVHRSLESLYWTGITAYGYNSYSADRRITFGLLDREAHANYGGNNFSFYTETGRTIYGRYAHLQPYAALEYIQLHQDDFVESGANSIDIATGGIQADAFRSLLGSRILANLPTKSGRLVKWEGRAAWRHEFLNENRILDASFAGQSGGNFAIAGINVDRDSAILGTGLNCQLRSNFSIFANYDIVTSENYTAHAGSGGLQYLW